MSLNTPWARVALVLSRSFAGILDPLTPHRIAFPNFVVVPVGRAVPWDGCFLFPYYDCLGLAEWGWGLIFCCSHWPQSQRHTRESAEKWFNIYVYKLKFSSYTLFLPIHFILFTGVFLCNNLIFSLHLLLMRPNNNYNLPSEIPQEDIFLIILVCISWRYIYQDD